MIRKPGKSRTQLMNELQELFNRYIRVRDKGKPCIYCGSKTYSGYHFASAAHYLPVSIAPALRLDTDNVHLAGYDCNVADDRVKYRKNLLVRIGKTRVEALEASAKSLIKLTTPEIEEKITYFKGLLKAA